MRRLYKALRYNIDRFQYFVSLTFPNHHKTRTTLLDAHNYGYTKMMSKFIERLQKHYKNNLNTKLSYFWKYELGRKTGRPHFHVLLNYNLSDDPEYLIVNGKETSAPLELYNLIDQKWNSGWIFVSKINRSNLLSYMTKYFTKTGTVNPRNKPNQPKDKYRVKRMRRWSTSRDIKRINKKDYNLIMKGSLDDCRELKETLDWEFQ